MYIQKHKLLSLYFLCLSVVVCIGATTESTTKPTPQPSQTPKEECAALNKSCDTCVKNAKCMYCYHDRTCLPYPVGHIFPSGSDCPPDMGNARWGVCWVNFKVLLIVMGVFAFLLLFVLPCTVYCCCCRSSSSKPSKRALKEDAKIEREKQEREERHAVRRTERQAKYDEIRRKYGLIKDDKAGYQRFDDGA